MKIKKFPVISKNNNEYEVRIKERCSSIFSWWEVILYKEKKKALNLFGGSETKLKKIYTWESGWRNYEYYIGKYKEMAIETVEKYEELIKEGMEQDINNQKGIEEFNEWDGRIN